jgi:hypothetical protein
MKGNTLMNWVVKLIFLIMLGPCLIALGLHVFSATFQIIWVFLAAILPWVLGIAVLIGLVAGISAGVVVRRRTPLRNDEYLPPGVPRVRRPREIRGRDADN